MTALTDKIDTLVAGLLPSVSTLQVPYGVSKGGRFYQGIKTPPAIPADNVKGAVDLTVKPNYQAENWVAFGLALPATQEWSIEIYQYNAPQGRGYTVNAWVIEGGKTFCSVTNVGPATDKPTGWFQVGP
jgi:hypothetical protein